MAARPSQPGCALPQPIQSVPSLWNPHAMAPLRRVWSISNSMTSSYMPAIQHNPEQCQLQGDVRKGNNICTQTAEVVVFGHSFWDASSWCMNTQQTQSSVTTELKHKDSAEVLWLSRLAKHGRVEEQLAAEDIHLGRLFASIFSLETYFEPQWSTEIERSVSAEVVSKFCEKGQPSEAVQALDGLVQIGLGVSSALFYTVLKCCVAQKNLALGRRVDELVVRVGFESNTFLANHLLRMYSSHGKLKEASDVFNRLTKPDAFSWSAVIAAFATHGEPKQAVAMYKRMRCSNVMPDGHVFVAALQACARAMDLESGKQVHTDILECGFRPNLFVWNSLVDMYAKCGRLGDARTIFDSLVTRDVVTWNAMIAGYAEHEQGLQAFRLYEDMKAEGVVHADPVTFACLLKACARAGALEQGKQLHSDVLEGGLGADIVVGTALVDMYGKCNRLEVAQAIFDSLPSKDTVTWTAMIAGYAEHGLAQEALALHGRMEQEGSSLAESGTFACLLKVCATVGDLEQGKQLHSQIVERGLDADMVVGTCLVDMYAKCGSLEEARKVFDGLAVRDVVTWNAMITGYAEHGCGQEALALHARMEQEGVMLANPVTYACLLKACTSVAALQQGKQLHSQITKRGLEGNTMVGNCLVHMYAKCGKLADAQRVFDNLPAKNVVTWNAMINGFGESGEGQKALECFQEMMRQRIQVDETTFTCLLVACSHEGLVEEGQQVFRTMVEECGIKPTIEHNTCMVDLLGRAGYLDEAEKTLLSFASNDVGFTSLLNACRSHGDIERGRRCFERLIRSDSQNSAAYVLMGNIYADAHKWSDVDSVESQRKKAGASKKPAVAGIEVDRHVHTFIVGEKRGDISSKARSMSARMKEEGGHVPRKELVLKLLRDEEKEDELCGHAEKLALAYGLISTPDGMPLLVTKNLRMCGDCHSSTEIMSRIEKREIVVRDSHRVHRFVNGSCRCGGRP